MSYDQFIDDQKAQDAVIRTLEIVGEAAKNLSPTIRDLHNDVPWSSMARLRDRLIHGYFGVNMDIVCQVVSVELPELDPTLREVLADLE